MDAHRAEDRGSPQVLDFLTMPSRRPAADVSVRLHRSGRWSIIEVRGEMDLQAVPLVHDLLGVAAAHVVFDLKAVTFMDASGLGVLIDSQLRAVRAGGCLRVVAPSDQARRLLVLARCEREFHAFDSQAEAVSAPVSCGPTR